MEGVCEEARVARDVEEQRHRTSETDTERGICEVEDKEGKGNECRQRERERTCNERRDSAQEEQEKSGHILTVAM